MNNFFAYNIAHNIIHENEDFEPKSIGVCCNRKDWHRWKEVIQAELNSLSKHKVFGPIVYTPKGVKPWNLNEYFCVK